MNGIRTAVPEPLIHSFTVKLFDIARRVAVISLLREAVVGLLKGVQDNTRKKLNAHIFFVFRKMWTFECGFEEAQGAGCYYDLPDVMRGTDPLHFEPASTVADTCAIREFTEAADKANWDAFKKIVDSNPRLTITANYIGTVMEPRQRTRVGVPKRSWATSMGAVASQRAIRASRLARTASVNYLRSSASSTKWTRPWSRPTGCRLLSAFLRAQLTW